MNALVVICVIAISLALDAVSVSLASGLKAKRATAHDGIKMGAYFGGFQAGMPLLGWLIGGAFKVVLTSYSGLIALVLLSVIGFNMIRQSFMPSASQAYVATGPDTKTLLALAVATSIDAFVVGITLGLLELPILLSVTIIGLVTGMLSFGGFMLGRRIGHLLGDKLGALGGVALIAIGVKLFLG